MSALGNGFSSLMKRRAEGHLDLTVNCLLQSIASHRNAILRAAELDNILGAMFKDRDC